MVKSRCWFGSFGFVYFIRGRWVHLRSFRRALGVVGFLQVRLIHFGSALNVVGFLRVRLVHSSLTWGSLGSFGFILSRPGDCWVHSGAPCETLCSFAFAWFIRADAGCRLAHSVEPCDLFGFVRTRPWGLSVHFRSFGAIGRALGVVGFIRVGLVHSGAPSVSLGSYGFIRSCAGGYWVHSDSFARSMWVVGFIHVRMAKSGVRRGRFVHSGTPWSIWLQSGSFGLFGGTLSVIGFICVRLVHSVTFWCSFGPFGRALGGDEFIGVCLVHSCSGTPRG